MQFLSAISLVYCKSIQKLPEIIEKWRAEPMSSKGSQKHQKGARKGCQSGAKIDLKVIKKRGVKLMKNRTAPKPVLDGKAGGRRP